MARPETHKSSAGTKLFAFGAVTYVLLQQQIAANKFVGSEDFGATSTNCEIASGVANALGLGIAEDPACAYGVKGCYNLRCRFCQVFPKTRSSM